MTEPIEWPTEPPTQLPTESPLIDDALPPPPPEDRRRPVATSWSRVGGLALEVVLMACTFGFGWVGWWIISWADGQSPSKFVLHMHVVRADDGTLASFGRMALREALGKGVAAAAILAGVYFQQPVVLAVVAAYLGASLAVSCTDARRRTLWDRLAGTVVLDGDPPLPLPAAPPPSVVPTSGLTPPVEASTALG